MEKAALFFYASCLSMDSFIITCKSPNAYFTAYKIVTIRINHACTDMHIIASGFNSLFSGIFSETQLLHRFICAPCFFLNNCSESGVVRMRSFGHLGKHLNWDISATMNTQHDSLLFLHLWQEDEGENTDIPGISGSL